MSDQPQYLQYLGGIIAERRVSEMRVRRFNRRESSGVSLVITKISDLRRSSSAVFCNSPSCCTHRSQVTPILKISTVLVPPPGLMGKLRPSESDSVKAGAGRPISVVTSMEMLGPPSGPGKATALMLTGVLIGVIVGFGDGRVMMAGIKIARATPTPTRSPTMTPQLGPSFDMLAPLSFTLLAAR